MFVATWSWSLDPPGEKFGLTVSGLLEVDEIHCGYQGKVLSMLPSHYNHAVGEKVGIRVVADHLVAFPVQ